MSKKMTTKTTLYYEIYYRHNHEEWSLCYECRRGDSDENLRNAQKYLAKAKAETLRGFHPADSEFQIVMVERTEKRTVI